MNEEKYIKRTEIVKITGAKPYTIDYLKDVGRLPIYRESRGQGHPTLYDPKSIDIVIDHLKKQ